MAETIDNQPIVFNAVADCHLLDTGMRPLAEHGDITQFQFSLQPCLADRHLIREGNFFTSVFWTLGSGWTIGGGQACHSATLGGAMRQAVGIAQGAFVRITFTLDIASGSCLVKFADLTETFTASGSYTRWATAQSAANSENFSVTADGSSAVCMSQLSILTVNTAFDVDIVDDNSIVVASLASSAFNFADGYFTCSIDWQTLAIADGCYTIEVYDPCPCSQGGIIALDLLTGIHNWTLDPEWSISAGVATFNGTGSGQGQFDHSICTSTEYAVTYTLAGMSVNETFRIKLGSSLGILRSSDGTFTENITSNSTGFFLLGESLSATQTFTVSGISIERTTKVVTFTSLPIAVKEDWGCLTKALAMCNDTDTFGFGFLNTGFRPLLRIPASLNRASFPMQLKAYEYSNGHKATVYGRSRVVRELGFDGTEKMHAFMHLAGMIDHFYVDDVEMAVEDDDYPSVSYDEFADLGGVALSVSLKTQLIENKRVSSASKGCLPGGNTILDGSGFEILDETDKPITDG